MTTTTGTTVLVSDWTPIWDDLIAEQGDPRDGGDES